ncbi:MAG TPA: exo-alpha-sialidase [Thermoanaerobaculia bacterium]|nr:exo-alpha-sialidase [Thermoanaerobaculia bacterium]
MLVRSTTRSRFCGLAISSVLLLAGGPAALSQPNEAPWESAIAAFEANDREHPPEPGGILFLGSSSIRFWDLPRWFPDRSTVNRGFGGSRIADSVRYFDRLVPVHRPTEIVFYAGDNDVAAGVEVDAVVADLRALLEQVELALPVVKLYFLALKPSLARWHLFPGMSEVNRAVAALAESEPALAFVDVAAPMLGADGTPRPELFADDGLHLNEAGYRLWTEVVERRLPLFRRESVFPLETWHNHGSSLVELPNGDLLVAWFRGSGERQADDVAILGARRDARTGRWSEPFVLSDTPGFPDTNPTLLVDPRGRLFLFHPTILDNRWESALMKVRVASDWAEPGPPRWSRSDVLHWKPGDDFREVVDIRTREYAASVGLADDPSAWPERMRNWYELNLERAGDKLQRRLGWFTRPHPVVLRDGRYLLGLYSDGFSFGAAAISDDEGATWTFSGPIVGAGAVQPSFGQRSDGTVVAFLRDNGPAPKLTMVAESEDRGSTWSVARDHPDLPEAGAGVDLLVLRSGKWLLFHNDDPTGRHRLAVSISTDEGRTFPRRRWLEVADPGTARFHYPSAVEARDGTIRVTYSVFRADAFEGSDRAPAEGKTIGYAELNEAWLEAALPAGSREVRAPH